MTKQKNTLHMINVSEAKEKSYITDVNSTEQ